MKKTITALCLIALASAFPASAQVDFSRYCALGDSLTAGYASGGLTQYYQERSYSALLADLAGATTYEQPLVSAPGIMPLLELLSLQGPLIGAPNVPPGNPINATYPGPYNNLGVPGSTLSDMIFTTGDFYNLAAGNLDNVMHDLILRDNTYTAIEQCIGQQPTFITMFIGNNDILGAVLSGTPIDGITMTPVAIFEQLYQQALGLLVATTSADIVVMTLPYATALPFMTTIPPFLDIPGVGVIPIMGTNGPLEAGDYVTLAAGSMLAQGYGTPFGPPLPEDINLATGAPGYVLRAAEAAIVRERYNAYNAIIRDTAAALGVTVLDVNVMFDEIVAGNGPSFGGWTPNAGFLVGGIFSYDGVHPQNIGYSLITVELINLINETFGAAIPQVNMYEVIGSSNSTIPNVANAKDAIFSAEAFEQLYAIMGPKLPNRRMAPVTQSLID